MTVRIDDATHFEPDALVDWGPRIDADATVATAPIVAAAMLSPRTRRIDTARRCVGYVRAPSPVLDPIADPVKRWMIHRKRGADGRIETRIMRPDPSQ